MSRGGTTPSRLNRRATAIVIATMFFMSTAPAPPPHVAVLHRARERVHRPLTRVGGGDDVEMAVDQQRPPTFPVGALQATEDVAAARGARVEHLDLVADLRQLGRDILGSFPFTHHGVGVAGVGGVDPDEFRGELDDLVGSGVLAGHGDLPTIAGPVTGGWMWVVYPLLVAVTAAASPSGGMADALA